MANDAITQGSIGVTASPFYIGWNTCTFVYLQNCTNVTTNLISKNSCPIANGYFMELCTYYHMTDNTGIGQS